MVLSSNVVCDGFLDGVSYRVQTHLHEDHMQGFSASKQFQNIVMSDACRELLIAEYGGEVPYRTNIHGVPQYREVLLGERGDEVAVTLLPNGHAVGSVQVCLCRSDGLTLGYSGDFTWPLEHVMQVDLLVVDSTYGDPSRCRKYSRERVESALLGLIIERLRIDGGVHLIGYGGTLQHALQVLYDEVSEPILAGNKLSRELDVYRRHGHSIPPIIEVGSTDGRVATAGGRYIRLYGRGDKKPDAVAESVIRLSARYFNADNPVTELAEKVFMVALSNHADFEGTVQYVLATGASTVVTDSVRSQRAEALALYLSSEVGIRAYAAQPERSRLWGR